MNGKSAQSQSYMWVYRSAEASPKPVVLFEYQPGRAQQHPQTFLKGYAGMLMTDGYSAWRTLDGVAHLGCMAHARRYTGETLPAPSLLIAQQLFRWTLALIRITQQCKRVVVFDRTWIRIRRIVDMPPGTGDIHLTLMQTVPVTGAVIVTTPQGVALADAKKGIAMFGQAQMNVPIIGLVENMSYFVPAELPENKYYIFGKEGGKRLADEYDLPFLGHIPLVQSIREGGDQGVPVMVSDDAVSRKAFEGFASYVVRSIAMRNANIVSEKIAETV